MQYKKYISLLSIILIMIGWFLEVYYYYYRLNGDGVYKPVAIIIGIGLTLFLTLLFINSNYKKILLSIPVIIFSVFCTASGQSFSLSVKDTQDNNKLAIEENLLEKKHNYQLRIDELKIELKNEQDIINVDLDSRMYANKNGIQPAKETIENIKNDIKYYEELRDKIIDTMITSENIKVKSMNTYVLISKEFPQLSPRWLKLYAQVTLSLFISLMAPLGISILSGLQKYYKPIKEKPGIKINKKKHNLSDKDIDNIITMLLFIKGKMLSEEDCEEKFKVVHESKNKNIEAYKKSDIEIVRNAIIDQGLEGVTYKFAIDKLDREKI